jgi:hypothetical protein
MVKTYTSIFAKCDLFAWVRLAATNAMNRGAR